MTATLSDMRPVYVVGVGLHPYQRPGPTTYVELGLTAVRAALHDAGIAWSDVDTAYTGTALLPIGASRLMYRHLGASGVPMVQVENASASGSSAFRQVCLDVASGIADVGVATGVDKLADPGSALHEAGIGDLLEGRMSPMVHFALLADRYLYDSEAAAEDLAAVAVKNHGNGALNPNAQRRRSRSMTEVLDEPAVGGVLTRLQCCPVGEGAAAVIVASADGLRRIGVDQSRACRVLSSVGRSEQTYGYENFDAALTGQTTAQALDEAGCTAAQLDVVELHDAFTVEELMYVEAMGLVPRGRAARALRDGAFDIGGRVAVNPSGGLLAMGHPIGPTGVGQICELVTQLRGEAGARQHPSRIGLAHMVGVGAVCLVHVLSAPTG